MRLAILLDRWRRGRGGLEVYLDRVLPRLAERAHVTLIARDADREPPRGVEACDVRARFPRPRPWRDRADARAQARVAREGGFDRVFTLRRTPVPGAFWQPHDGSGPDRRRAMGRARPSWRDRVLEALEEETLAACSRVLAVSPKVAREFTARRPGLLCTVLPPPLPAERIGPLAPPPSGPLRAVFCGQDARRKGAAVALAWFRALRRLRADAELVFWSRSVAHLERVLGQSAAALAAEGVGLRGWDGAFRRELPRAHLLLLPTAYDPCALAGVEAAAQGVPVLTTAGNGFSDLVGAPLCARAGREDAEAAAAQALQLVRARDELGPEAWSAAAQAVRMAFSLEKHLEGLHRTLDSRSLDPTGSP